MAPVTFNVAVRPGQMLAELADSVGAARTVIVEVASLLHPFWALEPVMVYVFVEVGDTLKVLSVIFLNSPGRSQVYVKAPDATIVAESPGQISAELTVMGGASFTDTKTESIAGHPVRLSVAVR